MLIKKELTGIPLLQRPDTGNHVDVLVAADVWELPRSGAVYVADIYRFRDGEHLCRFFSDGDSYYTCYGWPDGKWGKANPACNGRYGYYGAYSSAEDTRLTEAFFHMEERKCWRSRGALAVIGSFVDEKRDERRRRAEDNRVDLAKRHFAMYPALPVDLEKYCESDVFGKTYFFYGKLTKAGKRFARCGHCSEEFETVRDLTQKQEGRCPCCGMPGVHKAIWKSEYLGDSTELCVAARVEDQLLLRWLEVHRFFTGKNKMARNYSFCDYGYNLYLTDQKGKQILYDYELVRIPYSSAREWKRRKNGSQNYSETYVYTRNLREVFGDRYYNVDIQGGLEGRHAVLSFTELLNNLKLTPEAEYLFKLGMPCLAAAADRLYRGKTHTGGRFQQVLGVSRQFLPMYAQMNVTLVEHRLIRDYGKWISCEELSALRALKPKDGDYGTARELLKTMSLGKFLRYFGKQRQVTKKTLSCLMRQFGDYSSMAKQLKLDLSRKTVRYPDNICQAHDALVEEINKLEYEEQNDVFVHAVGPLYEKLAFREWEGDGYCIVLPRLRTDLIREGKSLHHCVGGENYYKKHIQGKSMIVFIRKAESRDKPFVTMEVDMEELRIIQCYGFGDRPPEQNVRRFAESYVRALKSGTDRRKGKKTA